ncbi:hypothetical protein D7X25_29265 [bacterium 1XD42-8]|nr:hypothetical protein D7X25_29265 [bacterium 1XD42-8]
MLMAALIAIPLAFLICAIIFVVVSCVMDRIMERRCDEYARAQGVSPMGVKRTYGDDESTAEYYYFDD